MIKIIVLIFMVIGFVEGRSFEEFQKECQEVGVQSGFADIVNGKKAKAIKEATKDAGKNLNRVFNGVVIKNFSNSKIEESFLNGEHILKEIINKQINESSKGNIFYEIVGYKEKNGLMEVKTKLTCSKRMYNAIQKEIKNRIIKKLKIDKKKICVTSDRSNLSSLMVDKINEYLISNYKKVFQVYDCSDFNSEKELIKNGFTTILNIDIANEKVDLDTGAYQLFSRFKSEFKDIKSKKIYGLINSEVSNIIYTDKSSIVNKIYEENANILVKENIKKLLIQLLSENSIANGSEQIENIKENYRIEKPSNKIKYFTKLIGMIHSKEIKLNSTKYNNHKIITILKDELSAKGIVVKEQLSYRGIETLTITDIKEKRNRFWERDFEEYLITYRISKGNTNSSGVVKVTIDKNVSPYYLYIRLFLIFMIILFLIVMHKNSVQFEGKLFFIVYSVAIFLILVLIQGYFFVGVL